MIKHYVPLSLEEALNILNRHDCYIMSGGTDLMVQKHVSTGLLPNFDKRVIYVMNLKELDEIFSLYAQKDRQFYEKFYKYRNIPFEESLALKTQRKALTRLATNEMYDFTRSNVLGYTIDGKFLSLRGTYNKLLDTALLNVGQGKETLDSAMTRILKDIGGSGLRTIN